MSTLSRASLSVLLMSVVAATAAAQRCDRNGGVGGNRVQGVYPNPVYDGRFTFARVFYPTGFGGGRNRGDPPWHHDYNDAEQHFTKLLINLTKVKARTKESMVLGLDDPELLKYPIAYMSEPGFWQPSDAEVVGLRTYLKKGGFLIFDDFYGQDIVNLRNQMLRVIPNMRLIEIPVDHPIFYHSYQCIKSEFYGIFEDNDPKKRMLAIVNQNSDLGEAWEWSDRGVFAIEVSNEAYKLGINYIIYAMTR
jgi:Domain of unknown function (DUF4159)